MSMYKYWFWSESQRYFVYQGVRELILKAEGVRKSKKVKKHCSKVRRMYLQLECFLDQ